jgi:hypothetical protein
MNIFSRKMGGFKKSKFVAVVEQIDVHRSLTSVIAFSIYLQTRTTPHQNPSAPSLGNTLSRDLSIT